MILEFAAMNEFHYSWFLVFFLEAVIYFWLFYPVMELPAGLFSRFRAQEKRQAEGDKEKTIQWLGTGFGMLLWTLVYLLAKWKLEGYIFLNIFSMLILGTIGLLVFSDRPLMTSVWMAAVFTVCIELGRILIYGPNYITGDHAFYLKYVWQMRIAGQVLKSLFAFQCRRKICEYSRYRVSGINWALIMMAIVQLIFMHYRRQVSALNTVNVRIEMETFVVLGLGVAALLMIMISHINSFLQKQELELIRQAMDSNYQEIQRKSETDAEIRRVYHDLKQQVAAINFSEQSDVQEEKQKLTESLSRQVSGLERVEGTGSLLLDSLLNHKLMEAAEKKVHLALFVETVSYTFIDPMDLCSIIGNAIDNALEAAGRVAKESQRVVHVKSAVVQGVWVFKVENTCVSRPVLENNAYISTKTGPKREGIGIRSIRYCAKKYHGTVDIQADDHRFSLRVTMPVLD